MNDTGNRRHADGLVGGDILGLITSGMYANPLAIYREYIQNSADAAALSGRRRGGKVAIAIDVGGRSVSIRDNGPGLSFQEAKRELIPIARSGKHRQRDRGFRGIGRLSGLAFGNSVTFLTRGDDKSPVTRITWDGEQLRDSIEKQLPAEETMRHCVTTEKVSGDGLPSHFFEARVEGIHRHAASSILNSEAVRSYIGEVCPVPFSADFPYADKVSGALKKMRQHALSLDISLNGDPAPITRPYAQGAHNSKEQIDPFRGLEKIEIPTTDGGDCAAIGWTAHSSYLGAISPQSGTRCLRARAGNIQIGDETIFDHLFSEPRFNRWCVAEIYILDTRIAPNGRRDYFEPNAHLRNLENYLGSVCRKIEQQCRTASHDRNQLRNYRSFLEGLEATSKLAVSGYLSAPDARRLIQKKLAEVDASRDKYAKIGFAEGDKKLGKLQRKLGGFQGVSGRPSLDGVKPSYAAAYKEVFGIIANDISSPQEAMATIENILKHAPN